MPLRIFLVYEASDLKLYAKLLFYKVNVLAEVDRDIKKSDYKIRKFRRRRDKAIKKYKMQYTPVKIVLRSIKKRFRKLRQGTGEGGKKKKSIGMLLHELKIILWQALVLLGNKHKFRKFDIEVRVGGEDAYAVSQNYGYTVQSVQYLVTFLETYTNLDKATNKKAEVIADFREEKWDARVNIVVSLKIIDILRILLRALGDYEMYMFKKQNKRKKVTADGRQQNK